MEQTCTTSAKTTTFHNEWKITNYNNMCKKYVSEAFCGYSSHISDYEISWHYNLVTKTKSYGFGNQQQIATLTAVIDSCNAVTSTSVTLELDTEVHCFNSKKVYGTNKVGSEMELEFLSKHLDDGPITLHLKFSLIKEPAQKESQLEEHFTSLLSNELLSDVTIQVGPEKFYAQKAILSVRSPVFAAMFQSGMKESAQNRIIIEDIEPKVFEEVLRFIYAGKVNGLEKMAQELLAAADKYALDMLRRMCERHLGGRITQETVLKTLVLADLYHGTELKDEAIKFICKNIKSMKTTDWRDFCSTYPELAASILGAMSID